MASDEFMETIVPRNLVAQRQQNGTVFVLLCNLYRGNLVQLRKREYKLKNSDTVFNTIQFRGHIVDCMTWNEKRRIVVDDSTECIECVFSANAPKEVLNEYIRGNVGNPATWYSGIENLSLQERQTVDTFLGVLKSKLKPLPKPTSFKIGNYVEVIAELSDFKKYRSALIINIIKLDPTSLDDTSEYYKSYC